MKLTLLDLNQEFVRLIQTKQLVEGFPLERMGILLNNMNETPETHQKHVHTKFNGLQPAFHKNEYIILMCQLLNFVSSNQKAKPNLKVSYDSDHSNKVVVKLGIKKFSTSRNHKREWVLFVLP